MYVGGRVPFGYTVEDKIVKINEKQAAIVRQVYNDYISGMRLKDIATKLKKQGIKTNSCNDWTINQISRMLRSPYYCGKVFADNTVYTNIYPPIISEELFDRVNKSLQTGKRTAAQKKEVDRQLNNLVNAVANGIFSKTTNQKLNELEQEKEDLEIKIARQKAKTIIPLDADNVYNWFLSFQNIDTTDKLACKRMIDMFVNKIVLYDDYFDIYFNTSDDENKNIKLDNLEDFEEIEKEQPSGSDCSHLVRITGFEPAPFRTGT